MHAAVAKVSPAVEVRSVRVRGSSYQVPLPLSSERSLAQGLRLLIQASRRSPQAMHIALGEEMVAAAKGQGEAIKLKRQLGRSAVDGRSFSHFRWGTGCMNSVPQQLARKCLHAFRLQCILTSVSRAIRQCSERVGAAASQSIIQNTHTSLVTRGGATRATDSLEREFLRNPP
eukprot:18424-Heterococcus_DN1.PRE.3